MLAQLVTRRATWVVMFLAWLVAGCQTKRATTAPPAVSGRDADHSFLLWKIEDSRTAQALIQACAQKHIGAELKSLCADMAHTRDLETEIASQYLALLYQENPPPAHPGRAPLTSKDEAQFATGFLKNMIRQDEEGRKKTQNCLDQAGREEIRRFCHLVERSRWAEVQLLQNQLCQLRKNCRWKPADGGRDRSAGDRVPYAKRITKASAPQLLRGEMAGGLLALNLFRAEGEIGCEKMPRGILLRPGD